MKSSVGKQPEPIPPRQRKHQPAPRQPVRPGLHPHRRRNHHQPLRGPWKLRNRQGRTPIRPSSPSPSTRPSRTRSASTRSDYNALNIKIQKRLSRGVTLLTGYTWSSNWDNIRDAYGSANTLNPGNNGPQDIYNISSEYARATNDIPNRFTLAGTWELPIGHGKQFLGGVNRWVDLAVGGWRFNDIMILQNGGPLTVTQTNNNSSLGMPVPEPPRSPEPSASLASSSWEAA